MARSAFTLLLATVLSAQTPAAQRSVMDLQIFYQRNCVICHGLDGSATDSEGKRLRGRDLTSPKEMKGTTDANLAKTIRNGIFFGQAMPAFKKVLSDEEIQILVKEIVRKAVKGQPIAPKADTLPVAPKPPASAEPKGQ